MRPAVFIITLLLLTIGVPNTALASPAKPAQPSVKNISLAFGSAVIHNDGAGALALLAPELRGRVTASQLPAILGVQSPPLSVRVVRWAFAQGNGDATLGLSYAAHPVTEHLYLHLYAEGWRITAIVPEDARTLQHSAETAVVAFCDAVVRHDFRAMRVRLTERLVAHKSDTQILSLLDLSGPVVGYSVETYYGGAAGANVIVMLHSGTSQAHLDFLVINDRDGWRISSVQQVPVLG